MWFSPTYDCKSDKTYSKRSQGKPCDVCGRRVDPEPLQGLFLQARVHLKGPFEPGLDYQSDSSTSDVFAFGDVSSQATISDAYIDTEYVNREVKLRGISAKNLLDMISSSSENGL